MNKRLTIHVRSKNKALMFKKEQVEIPTDDPNKTYPEYKNKIISKIFNTFAYKVDYNITKDDVQQYIASLNQKGYRVTKYYLSNIK